MNSESLEDVTVTHYFVRTLNSTSPLDGATELRVVMSDPDTYSFFKVAEEGIDGNAEMPVPEICG
jgi:hypothetical protein